MAGDFFPRRDAHFVAWCGNLRRLVLESPDAYDLTEQEAAAFAQVDDALQAAYRAATAPGTRTTPAVAAKNEARADAERAARRLSMRVKGSSRVSEAQKVELGINPRTRGGRHPAIRPPEAAPHVRLTVTGGRRVEVRLSDAEVPRRGRAAGAVAWTFVGDDAPDDINRWRYHGMTGKLTKTFDFPDDLPPGTRVWVRAGWFSPRGAMGPLSSPVATRLPGDGVSFRLGLRAAA